MRQPRETIRGEQRACRRQRWRCRQSTHGQILDLEWSFGGVGLTSLTGQGSVKLMMPFSSAARAKMPTCCHMFGWVAGGVKSWYPKRNKEEEEEKKKKKVVSKAGKVRRIEGGSTELEARGRSAAIYIMDAAGEAESGIEVGGQAGQLKVLDSGRGRGG